MTVGQKCAVFSNRNLLLAVQMGEKIIISQHHIDLAVRVLLLTPRRNHVLTSLGVTQMNEHVKRCFILDDFQQITIPTVGVACN